MPGREVRWASRQRRRGTDVEAPSGASGPVPNRHTWHTDSRHTNRTLRPGNRHNGCPRAGGFWRATRHRGVVSSRSNAHRCHTLAGIGGRRCWRSRARAEDRCSDSRTCRSTGLNTSVRCHNAGTGSSIPGWVAADTASLQLCPSSAASSIGRGVGGGRLRVRVGADRVGDQNGSSVARVGSPGVTLARNIFIGCPLPVSFVESNRSFTF